MKACEGITLYSLKAFRNCTFSVKMEYKKGKRLDLRAGCGGRGGWWKHPVEELSRNGLRLDFSVVEVGIMGLQLTAMCLVKGA